MVVISSSVRFIVCRATTLASGGDWLSRLAGRACIAGSILLTVHVPLAKSQTPPQQRLAPAEPQSKPPVQPPLVPVEPPQIEMPRPPEAAPANADQIKFVLRDVIIEGATIYSTEQLREFYASLVNTEVTLARLFEIAKQIQQKYRTDGYLLARVIVPPQTISDGVFRLQVIEGFIDKVRIEGDIGPAKERVQSFLNKIAERDPTSGKPRPLREQDAERYLLLADDIPGISVFGVLQRGSELGRIRASCASGAEMGGRVFSVQ